MYNQELKVKAIESFKDWSNYLLVTTVAALGWASTTEALDCSPTCKIIVVSTLTLSIVFGIFTLAVIPLVTETIEETTKSIYEVEVKHKVILSYIDRTSKLKDYCWLQHVFFLAGVISYAFGTLF